MSSLVACDFILRAHNLVLTVPYTCISTLDLRSKFWNFQNSEHLTCASEHALSFIAPCPQ